ncbi:MAG: hypothetical protein AAGA48_40265 [Myxococcota bacterium]
MKPWWGWMLVGVMGCTSETPTSEAWNAVFRVDTYRRAEGCDEPTKNIPPPQPFVGLGYGVDSIFDLEVLTMFWCETEFSCIDLPQANAWLQIAEPEEAIGEFTDAQLVAAKLCGVNYNRIVATQTAQGRMTLDVILSTPDPVPVTDEKACLDVGTQVANTCDERFIIEADRVQ